jgi:methyl-accepting chemotaxis protein
MDEHDFKRLLQESSAETHRDFKHLLEESSAETHRDFKRLLEDTSVETQRRMDERFDQVDARFAQTDARFDQIDARFAQTDARFDQVDARAAETNARLDQVEARTAELRQHIDEIAAQMKLDFGTAVEAMRTDVQRVADGVLMVNAKLDREAADIRAEMRQGFADTQALLRFSHSQLDHRVTALERAAK